MKLEKLSRSHCLIHSRDESAGRHEVEQQAVLIQPKQSGTTLWSSCTDEDGVQTEITLIQLGSTILESEFIVRSEMEELQVGPPFLSRTCGPPGLGIT